LTHWVFALRMALGVPNRPFCSLCTIVNSFSSCAASATGAKPAVSEPHQPWPASALYQPSTLLQGPIFAVTIGGVAIELTGGSAAAYPSALFLSNHRSSTSRLLTPGRYFSKPNVETFGAVPEEASFRI
jgi:hypothetical protein